MIQCASCRQEIAAEATKYPYCQGYQTWYKNPQYSNCIFLLPFLVFIFWSTGIFTEKDYQTYRDDFSVSEENIVLMPKSQSRLITYRVENNTEYKWKHISYEVIGKHKGKLIAANTDIDYGWVVQPNSESLLTAEVPFMPGASSWEFRIKDLESARY
ncbi:hypothetical protein [Thalassomonas haliotis]|uniref:Uncharacterized protein n=1 Tax=Thalassomonas haliotis TaxID=485448 RepID=A0ABY7VDU7_9GAMM|nr:hypothetical protein [Thalassomonas haliotis]WDE11572.1 hypothetical protein H3N35_25775 [Thalassomonas haliotis]